MISNIVTATVRRIKVIGTNWTELCGTSEWVGLEMFREERRLFCSCINHFLDSYWLSWTGMTRWWRHQKEKSSKEGRAKPTGRFNDSQLKTAVTSQSFWSLCHLDRSHVVLRQLADKTKIDEFNADFESMLTR